MVTVTTRAKEVLAELRASASMEDPDIGLRLEAAASGGLGLLPDRERPGDQIVEYGGEKVLLVDDRLSETLAGAEIDCETVGKETQLVIGRSEEAEPRAENNGASH